MGGTTNDGKMTSPERAKQIKKSKKKSKIDVHNHGWPRESYRIMGKVECQRKPCEGFRMSSKERQESKWHSETEIPSASEGCFLVVWGSQIERGGPTEAGYVPPPAPALSTSALSSSAGPCSQSAMEKEETIH